jgi:hypothetical protein
MRLRQQKSTQNRIAKALSFRSEHNGRLNVSDSLLERVQVTMDCPSALSRLADLSADSMAGPEAADLLQHLQQCVGCQREWEAFQFTLLMVSTTPQPIVTTEQSRQMWRACQEKLLTQPSGFPRRHAAERQLELPQYTRIPATDARRPWLWNWAAMQPRWGWAALGGAFVVLGGVWWFTPPAAPGLAVASAPTINATLAANPLPPVSLDNGGPGTLVTFERPPTMTSPLITHHSAMAIDPFTDHVGSTLVSYSATAPEDASELSQQAAGPPR